jgi:hypothetical protein
MARGKSQKWVNQWKDRLLHADLVWKEKGYSSDSFPEDSAERVMAAYHGKHHEALFGGDDILAGVLMTNNVFFSTVNVLLASLFARDPQADVLATAPDAKDGAARQERLVNHLVRSPKLRFKRAWNRALLDANLFHFGIVRHGFTPTQEKYTSEGKLLDAYDPARPDFPWMRRVAPWDIRIDPLAESFAPEEATWCAFRDVMPLELARKNPALSTANLKPTKAIKGYPSEVNVARGSRQQNMSQDAAKLVEIWWIYDKMEREWFGISEGQDELVRQPDEWPIPTWASLPYNLLQFNPTPDDPFGTTYSRQILPLQREINAALTVANLLTQSLRRVLVVNKEGLEEDEYKKLNNLALFEVLFAKGDPKDVLKETQVGGLPQELLVYITFLIGQIREVLGVSEMERAQRVNVETASEANQIGAGAAIQRGRNQGPWEDFLSDSIATFGLSLQYTLTDAVAVPLIGTEDATALFGGAAGGNPFETVEPEQIQGDFIYRIRPGSTLPRDPMEDIKRELAMNQALAPFGDLVNMPQRAIETVRAFEKDPAKTLQSPEQIQATRKVAEQQGANPNQEQPTQGGLDAGLASLINQGGGGRMQ